MKYRILENQDFDLDIIAPIGKEKPIWELVPQRIPLMVGRVRGMSPTTPNT